MTCFLEDNLCDSRASTLHFVGNKLLTEKHNMTVTYSVSSGFITLCEPKYDGNS